MNKNQLYRSIPKVDILLENETIQELIDHYSRDPVMEAIHIEMDRLRQFIGQCEEEEAAKSQIELLIAHIEMTVAAMHTPNMCMVINGTGTILHTNLGRAPIGQEHMRRLSAIATGYSNLEYNLNAGRRGERYSHFEKLLCKITGAMEQSGATLVEVGTTNKTHFDDYENAITEETKALLKVHTSNYRIVGFTESVGIDELIPIAKEHEIPVIEDLGSGVLIDLSKYGITYEPTVKDSIAKGADVVCFSGDKLLGGPQAGIIIGRKKYIDMMKKNQLTRALRIDKFTAAALEMVLQEYLSEEKAIRNIPVLRMITCPLEDVKWEAEDLCKILNGKGLPAKIECVPCESQIGGGSLPLERIPSMAVAIHPEKISVAELEERMRHLPVPVIPRTVNDTVLLDVRTIERRFFKVIADQFKELDVLEEISLIAGR